MALKIGDTEQYRHDLVLKNGSTYFALELGEEDESGTNATLHIGGFNTEEGLDQLKRMLQQVVDSL